MKRLGVNIDHVATLRQARKTRYPNPIAAAALVEKAGGNQITIHLREDRRHIQDVDVRELRKTIRTRLNLEMAARPEIVAIACDVKPDTITLVPERRQELTTEGGLDVTKEDGNLSTAIKKLKQSGIEISLFIEPDLKQIEAAVHLGADQVEFHTGRYCELTDKGDKKEVQKELARLKESAQFAKEKGLQVAAGHGLNYDNIEDLLRNIPEIEEYNIGHSIVSRAIFVGLEKAVQEMREIIQGVGK
ncbi:MAG: pyridoxine 5'-phosphate synthase [Deltaproteobacteria bacterium RIFCSPLOWO2_01_44_7]|nr:MAG: pyridoxine 5'-phosphate synthase [Deltaproteobacteria bacterium RIFCSPHIGHO2_01_FULL_43_49]OGQ14244.1 MAG: pyridoxine 5'-phosphate synthase [Deltaproteobacteria bacterium RIFCSPHIGHO2_02_FULL_44_53]OGQ27460.1 MAG: pyridoxine 5'-phosphate synthase [Deltaproteobacteria bacterium RIFCSPHIGHO2_12_FULL_44_21]OGQ30708.1 MAG: pyridoxine 5'-phosphate synthase [Deltaproteobacteria bacterium RIFCSPLOWO2_01_FULL_45_74]OGQ41214.1 MAG: pyridoxine 5'-phosphate synthase [Deltaproteobacteria bacterium 